MAKGPLLDGAFQVAAHGLDREDAEHEAAADGATGEVQRVLVAVEGAGHVAAGVQAVERLIVGVLANGAGDGRTVPVGARAHRRGVPQHPGAGLLLVPQRSATTPRTPASPP